MEPLLCHYGESGARGIVPFELDAPPTIRLLREFQHKPLPRQGFCVGWFMLFYVKKQYKDARIRMEAARTSRTRISGSLMRRIPPRLPYQGSCRRRRLRGGWSSRAEGNFALGKAIPALRAGTAQAESKIRTSPPWKSALNCCCKAPTTPQSVAARLTAPLLGEPRVRASPPNRFSTDRTCTEAWLRCHRLPDRATLSTSWDMRCAAGCNNEIFILQAMYRAMP